MTQPNSHNYLHFNPSYYQKLSNSFAHVVNAVATHNIAAITSGYKIKISPSSHQFLEKLSPFQRMQISRKIARHTPGWGMPRCKGDPKIFIV